MEIKNLRERIRNIYQDSILNKKNINLGFIKLQQYYININNFFQIMNDNTCNSVKISGEEKENFLKMNDLYLSKENKRNEFNKTSVHRNFNKLKIRNPRN